MSSPAWLCWTRSFQTFVHAACSRCRLTGVDGLGSPAAPARGLVTEGALLVFPGRQGGLLGSFHGLPQWGAACAPSHLGRGRSGEQSWGPAGAALLPQHLKRWLWAAWPCRLPELGALPRVPAGSPLPPQLPEVATPAPASSWSQCPRGSQLMTTLGGGASSTREGLSPPGSAALLEQLSPPHSQLLAWLSLCLPPPCRCACCSVPGKGELVALPPIQDPWDGLGVRCGGGSHSLRPLHLCSWPLAARSPLPTAFVRTVPSTRSQALQGGCVIEPLGGLGKGR